jgi:heme/copper-type cytochrome/quinol oxidase subunit 2
MPSLPGSTAIWTLTSSPPPQEAVAVGRVWLLFWSVAVLLGLLVLLMAAVTTVRRRRRRPERKGRPESPIDPWREAGRRARP